MLEVFNLTLNNVTVLLAFIGVGYLLRRRELVPEQTGHVLSLLCTLFFAPAYSIRNISQNLTPEVASEKLLLLSYGIVIMLATVLVGRILGKILGRNEIDRKSLQYAMSFSNTGYFGYPVVEGVFGAAMLADFIIFLVPTLIALNSYGYMLFRKDGKFPLRRLLTSPVTLGPVIGAVIGLSGIQLPAVVNNILAGAGNCMSPCSMLLVGFMLGKFPLKQLFSGIRPYYLSAIRLIGIPVFFAGALYLCGARDLYLFLALVNVSLPIGLNVVVFAESCGYEKEAGENARLCFISVMMALVTLPCVFAVLAKLCM